MCKSVGRKLEQTNTGIKLSAHTLEILRRSSHFPSGGDLFLMQKHEQTNKDACYKISTPNTQPHSFLSRHRRSNNLGKENLKTIEFHFSHIVRPRI